MQKTDTLTRTLAILGSLLVWIPILSPIVFSLLGFTVDRVFRFDYLMPAELFPLALVGGGLLLWAALRAHARRGMIGWGLGLAAGLLFAGQAIAVATGLASGEIEPEGWPWALALGSIGIYTLALVVIGTGGALLLRDLFRSRQPPARTTRPGRAPGGALL